MKPWYVELFTNYANRYEQETFTHGTTGEVNFIETELQFNKSAAILDIGCGTGRHAVELARRGYTVTGVDLSESMLAKARSNALSAGVRVEFIRQDARALKLERSFSLVQIICEGGLALMETDEMNFNILSGARSHLKSDGTLIFTTLNGLFPLYHSVNDFMNENIVDGQSGQHRFDYMTLRDYSVFEVEDDDGNKKTLHCNERYYLPSEITWMLKSLQFRTIGIFGCETGKWNRGVQLTPEHFEMLVIAKL
jgi:2-polyprenyl-3-methyl-5-hydroxy-6-metoxy-1,4-benzoquinol methylase